MAPTAACMESATARHVPTRTPAGTVSRQCPGGTIGRMARRGADRESAHQKAADRACFARRVVGSESVSGALRTTEAREVIPLTTALRSPEN